MGCRVAAHRAHTTFRCNYWSANAANGSIVHTSTGQMLEHCRSTIVNAEQVCRKCLRGQGCEKPKIKMAPPFAFDDGTAISNEPSQSSQQDTTVHTAVAIAKVAVATKVWNDKMQREDSHSEQAERWKEPTLLQVAGANASDTRLAETFSAKIGATEELVAPPRNSTMGGEDWKTNEFGNADVHVQRRMWGNGFCQ